MKPNRTNSARVGLYRLVRQIFPAPWLALFIFGSSVLCAAMGNYLAACWAFTAGAWCQAYYSPNALDQPRPTVAVGCGQLFGSELKPSENKK